MQKTCLQCGGLFIPSKYQTGKQLYCTKKCASAKRRENPEYRELMRERRKAWRLANPEHSKQYMREWHKKNAEYQAAYRDKNREKIRRASLQNYYANREANIRRAIASNCLKRYGLTVADIDRMRTEQNGCCAICSVSEKVKRLVVDHHHGSGKVRKLLCDHCNQIVGIIETHAPKLLKCLDYVISHRDGYVRPTFEENMLVAKLNLEKLRSIVLN